MKEFVEKLIEKIKVTSLEIIVTGTKDKPYFEIKYKVVGKEDYNIGYSSYDLNNVLNWKEECFEIVNQLAEEYNNGWIPCSERLPNMFDVVLAITEDDLFYVAVYDTAFRQWYDDNFEREIDVIAWQPLPQPYKENENGKI